MKKIGMRSGKLFRSFKLGDENTLTKIDRADSQEIKVTIGSKLRYAQIQNDGGFIKANLNDKEGRAKYKMEAWFWYKYLKTSNRFWLVNALKVRRKGGIDIKPTYYFNLAVDEFHNQYEQDMLTDLQTDLYNVLDESNRMGDTQKGFERAVKSTTKVFKEFSKKVPNYFSLALQEHIVDRGKETTKPSYDKKATWVG